MRIKLEEKEQLLKEVKRLFAAFDRFTEKCESAYLDSSVCTELYDKLEMVKEKIKKS